MLKFLKIVCCSLALASFAAGYYFGKIIPLSDQWTYFETLRTTSAIVFGVMGALLAVVYPEVVKAGFRPKQVKDVASTDNISLILNPLAHSALLLVALVLAAPIFAWIKVSYPAPAVGVVPENVECMQAIVFSIFCGLTYFQVLILFSILHPLDHLLGHATKSAAIEKNREEIFSNGKG